VLAVAAVEGALIHGKSAAFAGGLQSVGLGRSVFVGTGLVPFRRSHRRQGVLSGCRGGERRQHALSARTLRGDAQKAPPRSRTRPSLGPEARARQSPLNSPGVSRERWRGRFGIAVGQTCASRRNRHRGRNERTLRGSPRITASLLRRPCVIRQKRKEVMAFVPARKRELRLVSVRRGSLQKSAGSVLASNKLARSAPKRVAVRVNGGLVGEATGTRVSATSPVKGLLVCRPSPLSLTRER